MASEENLGDFYKENKKLITDYIDTRIELLKLGAIQDHSKITERPFAHCTDQFHGIVFVLFLVIAFSWFMAD